MIFGVTKDVNPKSNSAPRNPVASASLGRSACLAVPLTLVVPLTVAADPVPLVLVVPLALRSRS